MLKAAEQAKRAVIMAHPAVFFLKETHIPPDLQQPLKTHSPRFLKFFQDDNKSIQDLGKHIENT